MNSYMTWRQQQCLARYRERLAKQPMTEEELLKRQASGMLVKLSMLNLWVKSRFNRGATP